MTDPRQKSVLIIGYSQTREMSSVLDAVSKICGDTRVFHSGRLATVPTEVLFPELIIICQNWPDEFSSHELNDLISRYPISRFVCCYGAWCESDGRARNVWPLSIRVPARCACARIQQEWRIIQGAEKAFPLTAGRDEIFQFEVAAESFQLSSAGGSPLIGVNSGDRAYQDMLKEMIISWGGCIASGAQQNEADLLIYDLDPWELVENHLASQTFIPPMMGVMGLAHPETISTARLLGLETVVCKVAPERELFQAIECVLKIKVSPQGAC
ncbi:MAG: hypothetical protein ABIK07_04700 [Planctomycetota bacterium]